MWPIGWAQLCCLLEGLKLRIVRIVRENSVSGAPALALPLAAGTRTRCRVIEFWSSRARGGNYGGCVCSRQTNGLAIFIFKLQQSITIRHHLDIGGILESHTSMFLAATNSSRSDDVTPHSYVCF